MKKVIERMNAGVVEEQRKLGMASSSSKDTKKKWFSRKTSGVKDDKSAGGEEEEVEGKTKVIKDYKKKPRKSTGPEMSID